MTETVEQDVRADTQPSEPEKSTSSRKLVDPMESAAGLLKDKKIAQQAPANIIEG